MKFKNIKKSSSSRKDQNTSKKESVKKNSVKVVKKVTQEKERVQKTHFFPSNYRFITEKKVWIFVLLFLALLSLGMVLFDVYVHQQGLFGVEAERGALMQKEQYWQRVTGEKPNYRDGYMEVALYAYQLKDKKGALENVQKALNLDPNFEKGIQLQGIIEKMN